MLNCLLRCVKKLDQLLMLLIGEKVKVILCDLTLSALNRETLDEYFNSVVRDNILKESLSRYLILFVH